MTQAQMRKIGKMLKTGDAVMVGTVCDGDRWPDGNKLYIICDLISQSTMHVRCDKRPRWVKYLPNHCG